MRRKHLRNYFQNVLLFQMFQCFALSLYYAFCNGFSWCIISKYLAFTVFSTFSILIRNILYDANKLYVINILFIPLCYFVQFLDKFVFYIFLTYSFFLKIYTHCYSHTYGISIWDMTYILLGKDCK